jgi:hypothetical protein
MGELVGFRCRVEVRPTLPAHTGRTSTLYSVSWSDLPREFKLSDAPALFSEIAGWQVADGPDQMASETSEASLGGVEGLEVETVASHGGRQVTVRERMCIRGDRLYRLRMTAESSATQARSWDRFVSSFRFE